VITTKLLFGLAGFAFVSSITPGPNNLMLMTSGINFGFRRTIPHMAGVGIGFTLMIVLIGLGIAELLKAVPGAFTVIRAASVAYLMFLAWKLAKSQPSAADGAGAAPPRPITFLQAALFQWVNPKAWAMALTAVSAYTSRSNPVASVLVVAVVFGLINLPCVSSWTIMGVKLRALLADPGKLRLFNIGAALILVATLYPMLS
jgi:threonine/homoserine/homoserine lactone efflux protein